MDMIENLLRYLRVIREPLGPVRVYALGTLGDAGVALIVDTGSQTTFLSVAPGSPDQALQSQDAYGNPITLFLGTATLTLPGASDRSIPLLRTLSFLSLEDSNRALGGPTIHGLFGLTTVGGGVVRIDAQRSMIWFR